MKGVIDSYLFICTLLYLMNKCLAFLSGLMLSVGIKKIGISFFIQWQKKRVKAAGKVMPYMVNLDKLYFIQKNNGLSIENRNGIIYICIFTSIPRQRKVNEERMKECSSPSKAGHQLALVIQVLLDLLPHVKDGTVPAAESTVLQDTWTKSMINPSPAAFTEPSCCCCLKRQPVCCHVTLRKC